MSATLKEAEIRPDHLMPEQAERLASDIRRLLRRREDFVSVPCPACGSERIGGSFQKYGLTYADCADCATLYVSPRPTPEILEDYYANSENYRYWNTHIFPASEDVRRTQIFRPRAERLAEICRRYEVPTGTLLEVGAGFGTFCEEMRRLGWFRRVIAVEPTPDLAATCRRKGLEVIEKPIEQVRLGEDTIHAVASFEVVEHLFAPREFLRGCASLLAPGGLVVITCPNIRGFDLAVLRELSHTVDVEHLNYFHPDSLAHLLTDCGFEVLEALTPGRLDAELVRKKALGGEFDLTPHPFLRQVLMDEWERVGDAFQRFLADNRLSSHMWLVARKRG